LYANGFDEVNLDCWLV